MRRALPDELLSRLSAWVAAQTGLYFPQERWRDLEGGVAAAARDFGLPDAESCARWLLSTVPARIVSPCRKSVSSASANSGVVLDSGVTLTTSLRLRAKK